MNDNKKLKPDRRYGQVMYMLIIALVLMIITHFFAIHVLNTYLGTNGLTDTYANRLRFFSALSIIIVFLFCVYVIYTWVKTTAQHSKTGNQQELLYPPNLFDKAPIGYHLLDGKGIILGMNQTELQWLGYSKEEVVGKMSIFDIVPAMAKESIDQTKKILEEEGGFEKEAGFLIRKDGSRIPVLANARAIFDENGNFLYHHMIILDFTERMQIEEDLKQAQILAKQTNLLLRQKQQELEQNLAFISDLNDHAPIGFHTANAQGLMPIVENEKSAFAMG